jgi:hypothetical protein
MIENNTNIRQDNKISVFIDGDKSAFISKTAVDKFKHAVKTNREHNLSEIVTKYLKPEYNLQLVSTNDIEYRYKIITRPIQKQHHEKTESEKRRELLKAKINLMKNARTNSDYYREKVDGNIDNEILVEYNKLKKITKMPIPSPSEILANPSEYKSIISTVLNNHKTIQQKTYPYIKYFKLLAEKIDAIEFSSVTPEPNVEQILKSTTLPELKQVIGNNLNNNDTDTDTDTDD